MYDFESHHRYFFIGFSFAFVRSVPLSFVLLLLLEWHRSKDRDSFLAFLHHPAKLLPRSKASDFRRVFPLRPNHQQIPKAVVMESRHRRQILHQVVAFAFFQSRFELFKSRLDKFDCFFTFHRIGPLNEKPQPICGFR